jgi:acetyltransferase
MPFSDRPRSVRARLASGALSVRDKAGFDCRVRPIRPSDAASLMRGYDALSETGKWFRMLHALPHLPSELAARLCAPDPRTALCVVVEACPDVHDLDDDLLGGARIAGAGPGERAEFAVSVRPEVRGKGLAKGCLAVVLAAAREMGCRSVYGVVHRGNEPMKHLARAMGMSLRVDPDDPSLVLAEIDAADIPDLPDHSDAPACAGPERAKGPAVAAEPSSSPVVAAAVRPPAPPSSS